MKIEIEFYCGICGKEIDIEHENIYQFEQIRKDQVIKTTACEKCNKDMTMQLNRMFPKCISGLN